MTRALFLALLCLAAPASPADRPAVRVRASAAFAACAEHAVSAVAPGAPYEVRVETGDPARTEQADLVIGDDDELTRVLEGGRADVGTAADLGTVPWVSVAGDPARTVVPWTLAAGRLAQLSPRRPLVAVAALVAGAPRAGDAADLLRRLASPAGRSAFGACVAAPSSALARPDASPAAVRYAQELVDWWLPACSVARNAYNDPGQVLGAPNATVNTNGRFRGMVSLGQGGHVVVDLVSPVVDGPGTEVRVYQTTSGEPVTVYASDSPTGPFTLIGLQQYCGFRSANAFSNHCDFDLADGGLATARYLRVEDGEVFPCLRGDTVSEGADIDAIEVVDR